MIFLRLFESKKKYENMLQNAPFNIFFREACPGPTSKRMATPRVASPPTPKNS